MLVVYPAIFHKTVEGGYVVVFLESYSRRNT